MYGPTVTGIGAAATGPGSTAAGCAPRIAAPSGSPAPGSKTTTATVSAAATGVSLSDAVVPLVGVFKKALRRPGTSGLIAGWGPAASDLTARYAVGSTRRECLDVVRW